MTLLNYNVIMCIIQAGHIKLTALLFLGHLSHFFFVRRRELCVHIFSKTYMVILTKSGV